MSAPTLLIGLGGFGCRVAAEARRLLQGVEDSVGVEFLALDQDDLPLDLQEVFEPGEFWKVPASRVSDVLTHLDVRGDGPSWRTLLPWLPPGEGLELLDALEPGGARQYRSLGRMGYFVAAKQIDRQLEMAVDRLRLSGARQGCADGLRVVLVTSAAGGTGSGMFLDVAHRLRRIEPRAFLLLHLALPEVFSGFGDMERGKANTFATLAELLALRGRLLPFRPCQPCGDTTGSLGYREWFSRVYLHGRAAAPGSSNPDQTARAIAHAIGTQFEASLQSANRTAVGPLARLVDSPTEDPALGHLLSHGGAASVVVPAFTVADDCVIDFVLSDLERASASGGPEAPPPPNQPPPLPAPSTPRPAVPPPETVIAAAQAWAAELEQERLRQSNELSFWVLSGKYTAVDSIDPTLPVADKAPPRQDPSGNIPTLDSARLAKLPGYDARLAGLRAGQLKLGLSTAPVLVTPETTKRLRLHTEKLAKLSRRFRWRRWFRMNIKARLELLGALFANPSFVFELGIALRDGLAVPSEDARQAGLTTAADEPNPPPPKAVQDWLQTKLEVERPGLVAWYHELGAENLPRSERRERLRTRLAGSELETGLAEEAPLDGQDLKEKLNKLCVEASSTNPFIDRTPSCRQGAVMSLLVPERLRTLDEATRAVHEFGERQAFPVTVSQTDSDRLLLYSEDLLHPVTHLKRLDDYRQAYRNHGKRRALLHIDARFLGTPEDLYRLIGSPDPPPERPGRKRPEEEDKPTNKTRRVRKPAGRR